MPMWLLFALSAAMLWAVGQVLFKKGLDHISPLWSNILSAIVDLVIWIPVALVLSRFHITIPSLLILLAIMGSALTYMIFAYALSKANVSLTGTIWAIYPISTIILSFLFLGERVTYIQTIGIIVALLSVVAIGFPDKKLPKKLIKDFSWFWWAFIGAIINGAGDFLVKLANNHIGAYSQMFFMALFLQFLSLGNFYFDKKGRQVSKFSIKKFLPTLLAVTCFAVGNVIFFISFSFGKASLIAPVSSVYPAFMVLLAVIFLKEKISRKQFFGIIGIIIGVILLGL